MIKVVVNGYKGKMGQCVVEAIKANPETEFVGGIDVGDSLGDVLKQNSVDVVIDFTHPDTRMTIIETALANGACAVVGTTGFTDGDLAVIETLTKKYKKGVIIAPNFAVGTILQMHFAKITSKYFETAEIVEYHHNQKADFPSGTAVKTAQLMSESRTGFNPDLNDKVANLDHARGAEMNGIHIHSVRLPGMIAHQEVIFGDQGQYLTIRHDATSRETYMPGVLMAVKSVVKNPELVYGLESLLEL
jgi:4-hydroxy-tetrahydrodipicolinate reductase